MKAVIACLFVIVGLALAVILAGQFGMLKGKRPNRIGISEGKLTAPKTGSWNSVASQHQAGQEHDIAGIKYIGPVDQAMTRLKEILAKDSSITIVETTQTYLYARAQTKLFKFVDDVEFLIDESTHIIHVRSASRLGRKDFGVNRARIEAIRRGFESTP